MFAIVFHLVLYLYPAQELQHHPRRKKSTAIFCEDLHSFACKFYNFLCK